MKIIKRVDKKVGKKIYHRYSINLPKIGTEESGLLNKDLVVKTTKGKIVIKEK